MTLTRTYTQTHRHYISARNFITSEQSRLHGYPILAECGVVWIPGEPEETEPLPMCSDCENRTRAPYDRIGDEQPHCVYRCYDEDGNLLYVGCTWSWPSRRQAHERSTWWWCLVAKTRVTLFPDRPYALSREQAAIEQERPRWNVRHRKTSGMTVANYVELYMQATSVNAPDRVLNRLSREAKQRFGVVLEELAA